MATSRGLDWDVNFGPSAAEQRNLSLGIPSTPTAGSHSFQIYGGDADIDMKSAQLVSGNTVQFTYATTGNPGPFQAGLYRSTDGITYNPADLIATKTVTPGPAGAQPPETFTLTGPIEGSEDYPYLLVVADPANAITESNEDNNSASISLPWMTFDFATLQDIDTSVLRYLSVSDNNPYFDRATRVFGMFRLRGTPTDALKYLRLEIDQGGDTRAKVDLIPLQSALLRPFGSTGVIEVTESRYLFAVPEWVADTIDMSEDDSLYLRFIAISAQGAVAKSDYGYVHLLTRYTGLNRYNPRDDGVGGDDWVLPSVLKLLKTFPRVLWNDMSNMNGGYFWPHRGHDRGDEADFTLTGLKSALNDSKSAKDLADVINALPQSTFDQITLMYATVEEKYLKKLKSHLRDERMSFVGRITIIDDHDTHFHFIFRGAPPESAPVAGPPITVAPWSFTLATLDPAMPVESALPSAVTQSPVKRNAGMDSQSVELRGESSRNLQQPSFSSFAPTVGLNETEAIEFEVGLRWFDDLFAVGFGLYKQTERGSVLSSGDS